MKAHIEAYETILEIKLHPSSWHVEMVGYVTDSIEIIIGLNLEQEQVLTDIQSKFDNLGKINTATPIGHHKFNLRFGKSIDELILILDNIPELQEEDE